MLFKNLQSLADIDRASCRMASREATAAAERLKSACGVEYVTPEGDRVKKADFSHINGRETLNPR